ncbi:MAG: aldo/keto reductase [Actinomycetota bacterium]|nr:aldo/keto reductase [Actinomycetota bacterium]
MQTRRLGRTGHESSVAILGGAAFWGATPDQAGAGLALALERGVNHLDIAPQYGAAEDVVGPHLPAVRDRLFIGCKTLRHNADGVRAQLEASLTKFGTDHVDLYQMHAVTTVEELDQRAGALEAIEAARAEGLTRFVGITGHDMTAPATFVEALRRHDLDTVMFPVYPRLWADPVYRSDAEDLLAVCAERDLGVMAIKAVARRPWTGDHPTSPWYEPQTEPDAIERGVAFALSTPGVHAFCTPGSIDLLPRVLDAAERFRPLDPGERAAASAATAEDPLIFPIAQTR